MKTLQSIASRAVHFISLATILLCNPAGAAEKAAPSGFPIELKGKVLTVESGMKRDALKNSLKSIVTEEPSLDTAERLQYDLQLVAGEASATLAFDFDGGGKLTQVLLDAERKASNPAAAKLAAWLKKNAGKAKSKKGGILEWKHGGWNFQHTDGGSGEDAAYSVKATLIK